MIKSFFNRYPDTAMPFILMFMVLFVLSLWYFLGIDRYNYFIDFIKNLVQQYGLVSLFIGSFLEVIFMLGLYLPGSLAIIVSVAFSQNNIESLFINFLCIIFAAFLANTINYYLGRTGLYKIFRFIGAEKVLESASLYMNKHGKLSIILSGIHPNFLGIMMVYAGLSRQSFLKYIFLSLLSTIIWVPILMFITIKFTNILLDKNSGSWFVIPVFLSFWIIGIIIWTEIKNKLIKNKI